MSNILTQIKKLFGTGNWNRDHLRYWEPELQLNDSGFSGFQQKLFDRIKILLAGNGIPYTAEVDEVADNDKTVKFIKLILASSESQIWIYHDMAEYNINETHHIYEEWGYLKPSNLQDRFVENISELLELDSRPAN